MSVAFLKGRWAAVAAVLALAAAGVGAAALATHSGGHEAAAPPGHTGATATKSKPKPKHHSSAPVIARRTQLAALVTTHAVFSKPAAGATRLGRITAKGYYTREQTVLPVLRRSVSADGQRWLLVSLPGRPNGRSGWIAQRATIAKSTPWHIVVDLRARRVTVYHAGRSVRVVRAVVGEPATPTPVGHFFVQETIKLGPLAVGAPDALALSARSTVLRHFEGGVGQIGLHGILNVGGVLGTAGSHGCVRLSSKMMRWLALRMGPGTPVTITT
jgi:lipoprotein-anchoring transpeptidase ErfK/SrfK